MISRFNLQKSYIRYVFGLLQTLSTSEDCVSFILRSPYFAILAEVHCVLITFLLLSMGDNVSKKQRHIGYSSRCLLLSSDFLGRHLNPLLSLTNEKASHPRQPLTYCPKLYLSFTSYWFLSLNCDCSSFLLPMPTQMVRPHQPPIWLLCWPFFLFMLETSLKLKSQLKSSVQIGKTEKFRLFRERLCGEDWKKQKEQS